MRSSLLISTSAHEEQCASVQVLPALLTQPGMQKHPQITIVLVEDDPLLLILLETVLARQNYRIWKAETGHAALTRVAQEQQSPDMVLCDYQLPDVTGLSVIDQIRAYVELPRLPAILMSANLPSQEELMLRHIVAVEKPFTIATLLNLVQEVLRKPKTLPVFSKTVQDII